MESSSCMVLETRHRRSRLLARRLRKTGYSVLAPLLPGHGRNMESFGRSRATDWIAAAKNAYRRYARPT